MSTLNQPGPRIWVMPFSRYEEEVLERQQLHGLHAGDSDEELNAPEYVERDERGLRVEL